jgi:hypothetical protein
MSTLPRCSKIKGLLGGTGQPLCQRLDFFRQQHRCHRWVVHPSVEVDDTDSFTERYIFLHKTTFYINMGIDNVAWTSKPLHEHAWSWSLTVQHMLLHAALSQAIKKLVTINHNRCQSRNQRQAESQRQRVNWKPASVTSLELRHKVAMIPASRAAWSHVSLQIESQTLSKTDLGKIQSWAKTAHIWDHGQDATHQVGDVGDAHSDSDTKDWQWL